ncbi:MAG TPA: hypothetical protein VFY23_01665 [Candidatus Limnocylindrales bacterium]|nr:hypothetical protein [Candidatus Limnocylindrales bacterium]
MDDSQRRRVHATPGTHFRQGDVLLVALDEASVPATLEPIAHAPGRIVLAEGEVTGHAHAVHAPGAQLLHPRGNEDERLLRLPDPADLVHEEHATIPLPAGTYRIVIQREYVPADIVTQGWRRVVD